MRSNMLFYIPQRAHTFFVRIEHIEIAAPRHPRHRSHCLGQQQTYSNEPLDSLKQPADRTIILCGLAHNLRRPSRIVKQ